MGEAEDKGTGEWIWEAIRRKGIIVCKRHFTKT